ncbi:hypothetical protein SB690_19675, partial [Bacillus sp. SIMBA_006]|uniref:hypothetical protein n=1 Tax=Bacillus sp. SIMBA_006 TaxID=3085755 RepID=UPI00397CA1EA
SGLLVGIEVERLAGILLLDHHLDGFALALVDDLPAVIEACQPLLLVGVDRVLADGVAANPVGRFALEREHVVAVH